MQGASEALCSYVRARLALDSTLGPGGVLEDVATFGVGDVAEEAAQLLDVQPGARAGSAPEVADVTCGATQWSEAGGPGVAEAQ
eukprot:11915019-Alexandrium_andersonii.AAC.1